MVWQMTHYDVRVARVEHILLLAGPVVRSPHRGSQAQLASRSARGGFCQLTHTTRTW